ncbi:MAG: F0F1 ATP synthase subunit A [Planctomycetes bacterium]|nr:F0F1 ATP synthase subunit A [Planctomycetota bacterium]MCB9868269.1 F0F1 ATP synthase subunit A [Planctomycetota bacterium]
MLRRLLVFVAALALLWVAAPALSAQAHGEPSHGGAPHSASHGGHGSEDYPPLLQTPDKDFFLRNFVHLLPHAMFGVGARGEEGLATFYNTNLFQLFAVVLILLVFALVKGSFDSRPSGFVRVFRGWCHWLRDELVYAVMGPEEGRKWAPFFMYLFFFIAFMNLLGLLPVIGVTATATFYVTGTLAVVTFLCMLLFGFKQQGVVGFFKNLLPHGLPIPLILLMAPIELIGLFIKPFALMVRLFANMLGGHMVVYAFIGMLFLFAKMVGGSAMLASMTAVPAVGMSVFIMIIEGFVALLQAYVFTYLSVIFIHQAMHPAH